MLNALSQRSREIVLGVVGTVAAFFLFGGASGKSGSGDPFDAVPRDSFLVATVNLAELRRSPLYEVLLGKDTPGPSEPPGGRAARASVPMLDARVLGLGKLSEACGFDPLTRVEKLALAVPEEGDKGELGVAARVTVTGDELSKCTTNLAEQRGGKVATRDVGSFVVAEDSAGDRETARPRLAYGHGGLLVVGRGAWFDAMLAAADGKQPSARAAQAHAALRSSLTSRDGWHTPTVLVSALLPRSLRDRLKNEMGPELPTGPGGARAEDDSQRVMAGVLGVSGVGLALRVGGSSESIDGAIELVCDSAEACEAVEKLILKKRLDWSRELTLRMVGFGPLLDSIDVKREAGQPGAGAARIRVTAGAPTDALTSTIDRVLRLKARSQDRAPAPPPRQDAPPSPRDARPVPKDEPAPVSSARDQGSGERIPAPRSSH